LHQTDNHTNTPSLNFLQAGCSSWHPTNSVEALKAQILKAQSAKQTKAGLLSAHGMTNRCCKRFSFHTYVYKATTPQAIYATTNIAENTQTKQTFCRSSGKMAMGSSVFRREWMRIKDHSMTTDKKNFHH